MNRDDEGSQPPHDSDPNAGLLPVPTRVFGCAGLALLGCLFFAFAGAAMMGDYGGPEELRDAAEIERHITVWACLAGALGCCIAGSFLLSHRRKP